MGVAGSEEVFGYKIALICFGVVAVLFIGIIVFCLCWRHCWCFRGGQWLCNIQWPDTIVVRTQNQRQIRDAQANIRQLKGRFPPNQRVLADDFQAETTCGPTNGNYGFVERGQSRQFGPCVHKTFRHDATDDQLGYLKNKLTDYKEIDKLRRLVDCQHIVGFYAVIFEEEEDNGAACNSGYPRFIMERLETDLAKYLSRFHQVDENGLLRVGRCIAEALAFMHERRMVHRDIACRNVVVGTPGQRQEDGTLDLLTCAVKLTDVGLARSMYGDRIYYGIENWRLPSWQLAPEVFQTEKYGLSADVWQMGLFLFELWNRGTPAIAEMNRDAIRDRVCNKTIIEENDPRLPPDILPIVMDALQKTPTWRPSMAGVHERLGSVQLSSRSTASGSSSPVVQPYWREEGSISPNSSTDSGAIFTSY